MASLQLRNISKKFGSNEVVQNISLEIASGEFMVLAGPSGCGKSTLLRIIAGLEDADSGDILLDNQRINDLPPKDRDIAIVFQNYALYPHMTAYDNIAFGLKIRGMDKKEIDDKVREAAQILDISDLLDRKPAKMSGGQRQRVAIGRAIVRKPRLFLFDEPLSNLDASLRAQMRYEIASLHKKLKATIIYVTHDQVEAMTLASRITILKKGIIQQTGTPAEVYEQPSNIFVAGFTGSPAMNFLEGSIIEMTSGKYYFKGNDVEVAWALPVQSEGTVLISNKVMAGIRPEDLYLQSTTDSDETMGRLQTDISHTEWLGYDGIAYTSLGGRPWKMRWSKKEALITDKPVFWTFDPAKCHYFDLDTGKRLL